MQMRAIFQSVFSQDLRSKYQGTLGLYADTMALSCLFLPCMLRAFLFRNFQLGFFLHFRYMCLQCVFHTCAGGGGRRDAPGGLLGASTGDEPQLSTMQCALLFTAENTAYVDLIFISMHMRACIHARARSVVPAENSLCVCVCVCVC